MKPMQQAVPAQRHFRRLVLTLSAILAAMPATSRELEPDRVRWSAITLGAKKLGFSTSSEITFERLPSATGASQFLSPDREGEFAVAESDEMVVMKVTSSLLGRDSTTRFWLDSEDARVLQRILVEKGKRPRYKAYRFTQDGAWELRKNPVDGEEVLPHEGWSKVRSELDSYPGWTQDRDVTESAGLFYIIAASRLSVAGDRLTAYVVSKEQVYPIEIEVRELDEEKVEYQLIEGGKQRKVQGKFPALHLTLEPKPPQGVDAAGFKLLGLEGAVHVWIDPEGRFPLQISGKIPYAGKVNIRLKSVELSR